MLWAVALPTAVHVLMLCPFFLQLEHTFLALSPKLEMSVDGHALAFIEDQQAPTYIHNSVVVNGSEVVVR